jgi:hypothetical protein
MVYGSRHTLIRPKTSTFGTVASLFVTVAYACLRFHSFSATGVEYVEGAIDHVVLRASSTRSSIFMPYNLI